MRRTRIFCCLVFSFWLVSGAEGFAQKNTASVVGTIVDGSGFAVPGANVELSNDLTGQISHVVTDETGNFAIREIAPGRYSMSITAQGFRQRVQQGIILNVGDVPRFDLPLQPGSVSETVTVNSGTPLVETAEANIGTVVENVNTQQLPLNGRQFLQLTLMLPGVSSAAAGQTVARGGGPRNLGVQAVGNRATNNTYLIDGVDSFGFRFKNTSLRPSVASIDEFKVLESSYDPQYGVVSGLSVSVITKSGTNQIHGQVFEFFRNDALNAKNYFAVTKPTYQQNQYGGSLGLPIRKNKDFFFISYEGLRINQGASLTSVVPTEAERNGDFSASSTPVINPATNTQYPGNHLPNVSPIAAKFLALYPLPNVVATGYNHINSKSDEITEYQYTSRFDHTMSDTLKVFGRYSISNVDRYSPAALPLFGTLGLMTVQNLAVGVTKTFGSNTILDVHLGYNREDALNQSGQIGKMSVASFGINGLSVPTPLIDGVPNVAILGYTTIGDSTYSPEGRKENSEQFIPNLTHVHGRHTIRVGATLWPVQLNNVFVAGRQRGAFAFTNLYTHAATGLPDFELGYAQQVIRDDGVSREDARTFLSSYYAADDMRVTKRLSINVGVRYELFPAFVDQKDRLSTFVPEGTGRIVIAGDPNNGFKGRQNRALYATPKARFYPRVGLTYDLTGHGKTILRTGFGIFGNMAIFNSQFLSALNAPFVVARTYQSNPSSGVNVTLADPFANSAAGGGLPGGLMVTPWFKLGYMQQWSLGVQHQLARDLVLDVNYLGNKGTHLDTLRIVNQGALASQAYYAYLRPFQNFGTFTAADGNGYSNYHSLQMKLVKRFSNGFTFLTGYTYSHSIDNSPGEGGGSGNQGTAMDDRNVDRDRASSDFDLRQRFTFSGVWDLPFGKGRAMLAKPGIASMLLGGWQLTGFLQLQSGFPFTVIQSGNRSGTFGGPERSNLTCNPRLDGGQRTRARWFNTSCFSPSALGTFGNAGRNLLNYAGQRNLDASINRQFSLGEHRYLEFRGEFFNVLNKTQFSSTSGVGANVSTSSTFGIYTAAQDPRITQLAAKFVF